MSNTLIFHTHISQLFVRESAVRDGQSKKTALAEGMLTRGTGAPGIVTDESCKMYGRELRFMISPTRLAGEDQNVRKTEENEGNAAVLERAAGYQ